MRRQQAGQSRWPRRPLLRRRWLFSRSQTATPPERRLPRLQRGALSALFEPSLGQGHPGIAY